MRLVGGCYGGILAPAIIGDQRFLTNQAAYLNGSELMGEYLLDRLIAS